MEKPTRRVVLTGGLGLAGVAVAGAGAGAAGAAGRPGSRKRNRKVELTIELDYSRAPEHEAFALDARDRMYAWYPQIVDILPSDGWTPPDWLKLVLDPDYDGAAGTANDIITVGVRWLDDNTDALKRQRLLVHEETHVVQANKNAPGWFIEGTASWMSDYKLVPADPPPVLQPGDHYTQGYRPASILLEYAVATYDPDVVRKINDAGRGGRYTDSLWVDYTGRTPDQLWDELPKP